jgi:putative FmdB family regulatory protein
MPLFEYSCLNCEKCFTFLTGVVADEGPPLCPRCHSDKLKKLMSRFTRGRSDDARMEALGDRIENQDLDDPRQLRRFAREMGTAMGAETGEDLSDEMEAMFEEGFDENEGGSTGAAGSDDGTIY